MARGPKKHLKRINAPHHWMLSKLGGTWAPRPSPGPHKIRECMPLIILLRNRLRYALNYREAMMIVKDKAGLIKIDGKSRSDLRYPIGFQDVVSIERTEDCFRILYDTKGRFDLHRITESEAKYKLCKVKKRTLGQNGVPYIVTHDGRTIRYPHPDVKTNDTVKLNLETGEIQEIIKFEVGNLGMVTGGKNTGRIGTVFHYEKHNGGFDIVHFKDTHGHTYATRQTYAFMIGTGKQPAITLPKSEGVKKTILEEQQERLQKQLRQ